MKHKNKRQQHHTEILLLSLRNHVFCGSQTIETETNQLCSMFCRKKGQDYVLPIQSETIYLVGGIPTPLKNHELRQLG